MEEEQEQDYQNALVSREEQEHIGGLIESVKAKWENSDETNIEVLNEKIKEKEISIKKNDMEEEGDSDNNNNKDSDESDKEED